MMPGDWGGGIGPSIAGTISDLGKIRAEQAIAQGKIWGGALGNIGELIAQAPQRQALEQERQARALELNAAAQEQQQKVLAAQQLQRENGIAQDVLSNPAMYDTQTGEPDTGAIVGEMQKRGAFGAATKYQATAEAQAKLSDLIAKGKKAKQDFQTAQDDYVANAVHTATSPEQALNLVDDAVARGALDPTAGQNWHTVISHWTPATFQEHQQLVWGNSTPGKAQAAEEAKARAEAAAKPVSIGRQGLAVPNAQGGYDVIGQPPPTAPRPVEVRTVDESGKPITRFLPPDQATGQTFPSQPPASVTYPKLPKTGDEQAADDVKETVKGIKDGTLPPVLPGRGSKEYLALTAEAHRQGVDIAKLNQDWTTTQKYLSTLNGAQQTRLRQSINQLPDLLDKVDALAKQWNAGGFPFLNRANLTLAKNGAFGDKAASVANQLDAQISDVVSDLGNVYMGGNSPTDHALQLAQKSLSSDWSAQVLHDMTQLARENVMTRLHSIQNTGVGGIDASANPYNPQAAPDIKSLRDKYKY